MLLLLIMEMDERYIDDRGGKDMDVKICNMMMNAIIFIAVGYRLLVKVSTKHNLNFSEMFKKKIESIVKGKFNSCLCLVFFFLFHK